MLDVIAFLDAELGDAAPLLGADQHEIGLHIAGELGILVGVEGHQHEDEGRRDDDAAEDNHHSLHRTGSLAAGALIASVKSSTLVLSSPSVSR